MLTVVTGFMMVCFLPFYYPLAFHIVLLHAVLIVLVAALTAKWIGLSSTRKLLLVGGSWALFTLVAVGAYLFVFVTFWINESAIISKVTDLLGLSGTYLLAQVDLLLRRLADVLTSKLLLSFLLGSISFAPLIGARIRGVR
jgi:hypothetical protein